MNNVAYNILAQSTCKALIVDTLPIEKQQLGAAWGAYVYPCLACYFAGVDPDVLQSVGWAALAI